MKLIPLNKKVLVSIEELPEKTKSGLFLPQGATEGDKLYGIIEALGPAAFRGPEGNDKPPVKVGDKVVFLKYHGDPMECDGKKLKIMDDETILAVITE